MFKAPHGKSIWGYISAAAEIAPDIYMVLANDENGITYTGVMARKANAQKGLSKKAVALAEQDGNWLYYVRHSRKVWTEWRRLSFL